MRRSLAISTVLLGGCCLSGMSEATPPPAVPSPTPAPGPVAPRLPPSGCPSIADAILGTWQRQGFVEEYRAGGVYVLNGREGTVRWLAEGRAFLEVPPEFHAEYTLALADEGVLLAAGSNHLGTIYTRTSASPGFPAACWDMRDEIVGRWMGGQFEETYGADGSYRVNELTGTYSVTGNGLLSIETQSGPGDYYFALTSPTTAVAMMRVEGATLTSYTRAL
jgi:hypothetical protein